MSSIAARTETAAQRAAIHARLMRRNRVIGLLRVAVPTAAGLMLLALAVPLILASLVPDFSFANVAIDRGNLVVETPSYSGVGADGSRYSMHAEKARAALSSADRIELANVSFSLVQPDGRTFEAIAPTAQLQVTTQVVAVEGETTISGSSGITGNVRNALIDVLREKIFAPGGADLTFADGSRLLAEQMTYDGASKNWTFSRVTLTLSGLPGVSGEAAPIEPAPAGGTAP